MEDLPGVSPTLAPPLGWFHLAGRPSVVSPTASAVMGKVLTGKEDLEQVFPRLAVPSREVPH